MKKTLSFLLLLTLLSGCSSQKAVRDHASDYDTRPANQAPNLERPAWPNYDVHNENSFAVFNTVQSVSAPQGINVFPESSFWTLYRCKDATYVTYDWLVPSYQDWWFFRFPQGSAIIDADTGDRYPLREVEYFPMDQCFWIHGQSGEFIRMVLVYAPLPLSVKAVQFYEASAPTRKWMDGSARTSQVFKVRALRPQPQPRHIPTAKHVSNKD